MGDRRQVSVSGEVTTGFSDPQFIIELDGKLYVTLAVAEHSADAEAAGDQQSFSDIQQLMRDGHQVQAVVVGRPATMEAAPFQQTNESFQQTNESFQQTDNSSQQTNDR